MYLLFSQDDTEKTYWGSCKTKEQAELFLKEIAKEQGIDRDLFYIAFVRPPRKTNNKP